MNQNIKWLREKMLSLNLQGIIISNPINIKYLTRIEAEGTLLVTRKENVYITDGRYIEAVQSTITVDDEIIIWNATDIQYSDYENFFLFCENVGFEENYVTYSQYKEYMHKYKINNLVETENIIEKQRMIKDAEEIQNIKRACEITDNCFSSLLNFIQIGISEKEIAAEIERYFKKYANGISFDPIVASGPNSSMPHAVPTERRIQYGDIILLDFGCKYKDYCSDMTRTIFMGTMPDKVKPVYDLVLKNQQQTLRDLKEGANIKNIVKMVENDFKINNYTLVHSLGHGVGLEIHEAPNLNIRNESVLKENMIITNEPGIYIPNEFGIRIEDTVLITKTGSIKLTQSAKNYTIIKVNGNIT